MDELTRCKNGPTSARVLREGNLRIMWHRDRVVPSSGAGKLRYIDCLRGYAIALVIMCHGVYLFPNMPYPVHRVAVMGWFGVQLFFLASCVTLLRSWHREQRAAGTVFVPGFFVRRFCRIAPAYYLAAWLYALLDSGHHSLTSVLTTLTFTNTLYPVWTLGTKTVVPGGWSVGAEFAFYALFPVFAAVVTSMRRAVLVFVIAIICGTAANLAVLPLLVGTVSSADIENGLFFWFPDQAAVFALGGIVYFLIQRPPAMFSRHPAAIVVAAVGVFMLLSHVSLPHYFGQSLLPPMSLVASVILGIAVVAMSIGPRIFINDAAAALGRVSFSAYLLHFAILEGLRAVLQAGHVDVSGVVAIGAFAVVLPLAIAASYVCSVVTFRFVEQPMISVGHELVKRRWRAEV